MGRFVVEIHRGNDPVCYYLSRNGFRCYEAKNVAVLHTLADAERELAHFAALMPLFRLSVAQLPPRVSLATALLRSVPVAA